MSLGPRGAKLTVGKSGVRATAGIPGSGIFYSKKLASGPRRGDRRSPGSTGSPAPRTGGASPTTEPLGPDEWSDLTIAPEAQLDLGFFQRFTVPEGEKAFVDGCRAWLRGGEDEALGEFERATALPDAALLAGLLHLRQGRFDRARSFLQRAFDGRSRLSQAFAKYGVSAHLSLRLSEELWVLLPPGEKVTALALIEADQHSGRLDTALERARALFRSSPSDALSGASFGELLLESSSATDEELRAFLSATSWVEADTVEGAALLLFRGIAAHRSGLPTVAREAFTKGLRRRKGRPTELLAALHAARRDVYRDLGDGRGEARDQEWLEAHGYSGSLPQ